MGSGAEAEGSAQDAMLLGVRELALWLRDPRLGSCAPLPAPSRGRRASGTRLWHLAPPLLCSLAVAAATTASISPRAHPSPEQIPPPSCLHPWGVLKGAEATERPRPGAELTLRDLTRLTARV